VRRIEVLGPGCRRCEELTKNAREAISMVGVEAEVIHVTDAKELLAHGILWSTPGLVIDGRLVSVGRVLSARDIAARLTT
jgi:small redox-active disulfide protein 2